MAPRRTERISEQQPWLETSWVFKLMQSRDLTSDPSSIRTYSHSLYSKGPKFLHPVAHLTLPSSTSSYLFSSATSLLSLITPHLPLCWVRDQWQRVYNPAAVCQTCRKCSGGHQNWRACPQFSSIVWTKWVKLGPSSPNIGTQSHGNDILVMPNCFPWCVVIVWPGDASVGLQAAKMLSAYQAPYAPTCTHEYRYLTAQQLHSTIILHLHCSSLITQDCGKWYIDHWIMSGLNRVEYWLFSSS